MTPNSTTINFDPAIPTDWEKSTYYVRDAQGNVMAIYEYTIDDVTQDNHYTLTERNIYGSSRLGNNNAPVEMIAITPPNTSQYSHYIGYRQYELSNHLGNVHVVISDRKLPVDDGVYDSNGNQTSTTPDGIFDYYEPDVISAVDHYPGGFPMPGRSFNGNSYRYGYNQGSEKDDEITGVTGSHFTTYWREGDTRLLRWWSNDPKASAFPWQTPYSYMDGNPIANNDPLGDDVKVKGKKEDREAFKNELETLTGLDLVFKGKKLILNDRTRKGLNPDKGSSTARNDLIGAIEDDRVFKVKIGGKTSGGNINTNSFRLGSSDISRLMGEASRIGLNPLTVGYGLTFFHELDHFRNPHLDPSHPASDYRATFGDLASLEKGPTVEHINNIRAELDAIGLEGGSFGQRKSYFIRVGNTKQIPFTKRINGKVIEVGRLIYTPNIKNKTKFERSFDGQRDFGK